MTFFLDLWQDLREKRLWPVAVGLLAAAAAIPAIMLKPAATPSDPPTVAAKAGQAETLPVVDVDTSPTHGSKLQTFDSRNPFKPLADLQQTGDSSGSGSGGGSSPAPAGGQPGGGAPSGAGSPGGGTPSGGGAPSGGGSPTPSGGGGTTGGGTTGGGTRYYKFTADLEFGTSDNTKTMKSVEPLSLLPSTKHPVLVFMGVSSDAKSAQFFLVDPGFTPDGEGDCNSAGACQFITLRLDDGHNEETFTSVDGSVAYDLKLLKLRREEISASEAKGDATDAAPNNGKRAKSEGGETIAAASGAVLPRLIAGSEQPK